MTFRRLLPLAGLLLALVPHAKATVISTFSYQFTASDPIESGRPSRSGTPQDWTGTETYTGTVAGTYFYKTFILPASLFTGGPYVDISTLDPTNGNSYFIAAYANTYNVNSRATNWLGDAGFSGNYSTYDGGYFQVFLNPGSDLVLVLNSTATGVLPTYPINVQVGAYSDTQFSDPVPEPASWIMVGTGLLGMGAAVRRRLSTVL